MNNNKLLSCVMLQSHVCSLNINIKLDELVMKLPFSQILNTIKQDLSEKCH